MILRGCGVVLLALLAAAGARAETSGVSATGFTVTFAREVNATPDRLWTALTQVQNWWTSSHTFSGKAANMSFDLRAGGCWCETWDGGSVMHGTVVYLQPHQVLRFYAQLGPLQDRAANGVLTLALGAGKENKDGSRLRMVYKVSGPADAGLQELAPKVDEVLGEQVRRLVLFAETGKVE
jgi:uncharacterized protein YndB with AHSA1/START domain